MAQNPGLDLEEEDPVAAGAAAAAAEGSLDDDAPSGGGKTGGSKATETTEADDAEFGDEGNYRRPGELELLKVTQKNVVTRFSVLTHPETGKAMMKKGYIHYVQNKGYARCHSKRDGKGNIVGEPAFCCKMKEAEARFMALVVEYLTVDPKTGKFLTDKPVEFEIKALGLSRIGYKELSQLPGDDEKVTNMDISATPKDQTKGLKYGRMAAPAAFNRRESLKKAVLEAAKPFLDGRELHRRVGKDLNVVEMKAHLGVGTSASAGDDGPGMDDLA